MWIVGHLIALTAAVGFVLLGLWQLQRHDERRAFDVLIGERIESPAVPLSDLLDEGLPPANLEYRRTLVDGTYLVDDEVILQARSLNGRSGHEVLTPLVLDDGTAVVVDRGWVPIDVDGPPVVGAVPPVGVVEVTGFIRLPQVRSGLGPIDPPDGRLERISRVDIERLASQTGAPLQPFWIQLATQIPPQTGEFPLVIDAPVPGGGPPHLSYAVQWFAFAAIVMVAYPVLIMRTAGRGEGQRALE